MANCDVHGSVQSGKTASLYVTVVKDGQRWKRRLRQCADCVSSLRSTFGSQWSDGFVLTKFNAESACVSCGELRGEDGKLHPLYATGFTAGDKRFDYYGVYCELCAQSVISQFGLQQDGNHAA